jgi:release factor glutamine methyltransferase
VLAWAADDFRGRGFESPRLEAELLLSHGLGCDRIRLVIDASRPLTPEELTLVRQLIQRRRRHEPIAYILKEREFWGRKFLVTPAVLIPRPDTEVLVETALELTKRDHLFGTALDVCTGSGCVAVSFALERPTWRTWASDVSAPALDVARSNAARLGASEVVFRVGDLFQAVGAHDRFSLITANPPYISTAELPELQPDIREYEPVLALTSGLDGLDLVRRLVSEAPRHLEPGGHLAMEVGAGQAEVVKRLFTEHGFVAVGTARDLGKHERVVFGQVPPS